MSTVNTYHSDISALYDFEEDSLEYFDGPLEGWLVSRDTGERFAFRCLCVVTHRVWHWSLVSASADSVDESFKLSDAGACEWTSILEDRRGEDVILTIAKIGNKPGQSQ